MASFLRIWRPLPLAVTVALMLLASALYAADDSKPRKAGQYNPQNETVEMFAAIQSGDIAVKLIPKDSTLSRVLIENKTDKPLNIKLPDAFAGVPSLAQIGTGTAGRGAGRGGGRGQAVGGGMGMGGMGMGGMGGGMGGFMNVAPEKVGQCKVTTVCLEHGKVEPRESMHYDIKPLDTVTTKPGVRELCQMLGNDQANQRAAQAAAWHLNNGMSWQQLAAKSRRHADGSSEPYFSQEEIQLGMQIASAAERTAREQQSKEKPKSDAGASSSNSRY